MWAPEGSDADPKLACLINHSMMSEEFKPWHMQAPACVLYYSQGAERTASADESVLTPRRTTIREERSPAVRPGSGSTPLPI